MALTFAEHALPNTSDHCLLSDMVWAPAPISLFVAVGQNTNTLVGLVYTSPDGVTWTARTAAENNGWRGVAYSPTAGAGSTPLLCAVSTNGTNRVMTSPDGINWTSRSASAVAGWRGICWSSTRALFVAVGSTSVAMWSADGITWTNGTGVPASKSFTSVEWSSGLGQFAAVAATAGTASIMTSIDGKAWTGRTHPTVITLAPGTSTTGGHSNIVWSPTVGLWCVPALISSGPNLYAPLTSPDGVTWTQQTLPTAANISTQFMGVTWDTVGVQFVGIGAQQTAFGKYVWTSPTGTTWTCSYGGIELTDPNLANIWNSPTLFVAQDSGNHDLVITGAAAAASISPSSARDLGDVTVTITGDGVNGGFTNQTGANFVVVFYPFAALGLSAPDFVTNYFLGGGYRFGLQASAVTWVSPSALTCTPPHGCGDGSQYGLTPGPISVDVAVFDLSKFLVSDPNCQFYAAASFTYIDPVMLSVSPTTGTVLGGETITITGTNFYPDEVIFALGTNTLVFGQANAFCTYVNSTTLTCVAPTFYGGVGVSPIVNLVFRPSHLSNGSQLAQFAVFVPASTTLTFAYTYTAIWWVFDPALGFDFEFFDLAWEDFDFGYGIGVLGSDQFVWYYNDLVSPSGRTRGWIIFGNGTTPPDTNGWWMSIDGFAGSILIVASSRPKNPRTWANFATFATGTAAMLGGSPGYGCVLENKLIYAATGYTTFPPIRIFDGSFDRELCTLPPTAAGTTPYAIVSLLAANGTIYVSTLDTGTDSTTWVGRVFSLDIATAELIPIGAAFTTGHVPYALAWHNGRLYCGTHRQVSTAVGKIYSILPGVDTAWAEDHDLAASSMTGVSSMLSFQGTLFVGCTAAAGTFAQVIKRATDGTYSTATTGSGGTAKANNGFLSLAEFNGVIYAGYWNNDTTAVTSIRKSSDGITWSVSFTGATTTLRPIIALFVDDGVLYAIGGGLSLTAAILSTVDGVTWTNLTALLPDTGETTLPVFGVVVF